MRSNRRGSILVLSAVFMIVVMGLLAFSVDAGYLALTRTRLQGAADAAALAAANELAPALAVTPAVTAAAAQATASQAAVSVAGQNGNADQSGTLVTPSRDLRFGRCVYDPGSNSWVRTWGASPSNMVEVTTVRGATGSTGGDKPINLFFAPVMGRKSANIDTVATAALLPGVGFQISQNSTATVGVLPIALDVSSWNALLAGTGSDSFRFNESTGAVTSGSDGIREVNLYPSGSASMPPGNRGTVDLGSPNNSTNDLKRQILYGLNASDLAFFGGTLRTDTGNLILNGDTGISAGIKAELEQIIGQPRLIPLFSAVSGPGNNAMYTIPKFVGIRILSVQLTGKTKTVIVQPAPFVSSQVVRGATTIQPDSYFTRARLID
jgi:Flp pilus assembly protein TadG